MQDAEVLEFTHILGEKIGDLIGESASFLKSKGASDRMIYISLLTAISSSHSSMFLGVKEEEINKQLENFVELCKQNARDFETLIN